jgi:nucleoside-diphosphate-sugar epimerase
MKVFIAGATGVLGRPTVRLLVGAGHEVSGVARSADKAQLLRDLGAEPVSLDLYDVSAATRAVAGHDAVVHMATSIPRTARAALPGAWKENDRLRSEGTRVLAAAALAAGVPIFVKESISFTYPDGGDQWIDETVPVNATRFVASAVEAEEETARFSDAGGRGIVLRFAQFYGPEAAHTEEAVALARKRIAAGLGAPDAYLSVIHTDDAAAAVVAALAAPAGVYNVGDDEPLPRREHFAALADAFGLPRLRRLPRAARYAGGSKTSMLGRSQRISNRRLRDATGWAPRHPSAREGWAAIAAAMAAASRSA